mmetsp:Transcript_20852/g.22311  ORF Transcript_20852/g.22311 Transcript_20852/m.22311 type:complete len:200 (+) Transcript_20852:378-977(+)
MTLQNQDDLKRIEEKDANDKSNRIKVAERRLKNINAYNGSWENNGTVLLASSTQTNLKLLLNIFLIKGQADLKKNITKNEVHDKVINELDNLNITKIVIDSLKLELIELIRELGGEYTEPEQQQDSSRVRRRGRPRKEKQLTVVAMHHCRHLYHPSLLLRRVLLKIKNTTLYHQVRQHNNNQSGPKKKMMDHCRQRPHQ